MSNTFTTPKVVTTINQSRLDYNNALTSLLQNFASAGQPNPASIILDDGTGLRTGMLWYKSGSDQSDGQGRLFIYNGSQFTRDGITTYKMSNIAVANSAAAAGRITYGDLVLIGNDALFQVNTANNGIVRVGADASTITGLTPSQFVRSDINSNAAGNVTFTSTGFIKLPSGTDGNRPGSAVAGMIRFNTTSESFEGYNGTEWGEIGGGGAFTNDGSFVYYTGGLNVGIGIATPDTDFQVDGSGTLVKLKTNTAGTEGVTLRFTQSDTTIENAQGYGGIEWEGADSGGSGVRGYIRGFSEGTSGEFGVRIATQGSGASSPVDRVYVNQAGNVGIKVTSPNSSLAISGNLSFTSGDVTILNRASGFLGLGVGSTPLLRINSTDNVSINSSSADAKLHVAGTGNILRLSTNTVTDANGVTLRFDQTDTTIVNGQGYGGVEWSGLDSGNEGIRGYIKGFSEGSSGEFSVRIATQGSGASAPVDALYVTSIGNVGVRVANPSETMEVWGVSKANLFSGDGGLLSNLVNAFANDFATFLTLSSNDGAVLATARGNDHATLLSARSNDFATFSNLSSNDGAVLATARGNDHATLLSARSNDFATFLTLSSNDFNTLQTARANDFNSYQQVTVDIAASLLTARANDFATFLTLSSNDGAVLATARGNDHSTLLSARANDFATFSTLQNNINTVQTNLASVAISITAQTFLTVSSSNSYTMSRSVSNANNILVFIDGIAQIPNQSYQVFGNTTLRINNTQPLLTGLTVDIRYF
jgi:hypothetical protein